MVDGEVGSESLRRQLGDHQQMRKVDGQMRRSYLSEQYRTELSGTRISESHIVL